jgi:glucokinase
VTPLQRVWLGFDVGGQAIKGVLVRSEGETLAEDKRPTGLDMDTSGLTRALGDLCASLTRRAPAATEVADVVGVGVAGVMASDGLLAGSPNLPKVVGAPVRRVLSDALGRPVALDNDAHCAALAEAWHGGAAEGCRDFLLVTLGSGVGSGLVLRGDVHRGVSGYGCELGHTVVAAGGRACGCGNAGCLEAYVSESAARSLAHEAGPQTAQGVEDLVRRNGWGHAQSMFALADDGDAGATAIVDGMIYMLGIALASAVNMLDVTLLVLGGGIAPGVVAREDRLRAAMDTFLFARPASTVTIRGARRGAEAGAVGAARLAMLSVRPARAGGQPPARRSR